MCCKFDFLKHRQIENSSILYLKSFIINISIFSYSIFVISSVLPLHAKKVQIQEIVPGGFAVRIQQCVKKSGGFWVIFSVC